MSDLANSVADIRATARRFDRLDEAESRLLQLIARLSVEELVEGQEVIRSAITESFLPKRQARLHKHLTEALGGSGSLHDYGSSEKAGRPRLRSDALQLFKAEVHTNVVELADRHLFQWPSYESFMTRLLDVLVPRALAAGVALTELTPVIREELASHSAEIFQRGFKYATDRQQLSFDAAIDKANSGLNRLLDIPTSEYRRQLTRLREASKAGTWRSVCSAVLSGVLLGRCRIAFGALSGKTQLLNSRRLWVHYLPFLVEHDLERLAAEWPVGLETERLLRLAKPLSAALDEQVARSTNDRVCVLRSSVYMRAHDRLELTLIEPISGVQKEVTFHCYLGDSSIATSEIESAVARGMELIMLPLSEELSRWAWRHDPPLWHLLIDTSRKDASHRLRDLLNLALASIGAGTRQDVPLTYNFARRFPLDKPDIGADFRVPRLSVIRLLDQHHTDNGVRVWCSVRRSGKTTACLDLQNHRGPDVIITETCESTGVATLRDTFFQATLRALESGTTLSPTFVSDSVRRAADYDTGRSRVVFVLDEYESLFRCLENAALESEQLRYRVVQPLLNQMVAFAQDNLVILLGLRPDAHFILMDQNQLSPYVRADQFPLFEFAHNRPDCEFRDLVRRVLTERISCDDGFVGHLYAETGGHPVLTVNVLVALCDWLIASERPLSRLKLGARDFETFATSHLSAREIALSDVYDVHRKFAQQGLSAHSRERLPWLYAVLNVLRYLALKADGSMSCSVDEVERLIEQLGLHQSPGIDARELVRSGAMANFFITTSQTVKPRIRLYARLTAAVVPSARV